MTSRANKPRAGTRRSIWRQPGHTDHSIRPPLAVRGPHAVQHEVLHRKRGLRFLCFVDIKQRRLGSVRRTAAVHARETQLVRSPDWRRAETS